MPQVSRPVLLALVATLVLAAGWLVFLRPHGVGASGAAPAPPTASGFGHAVDKAHGAVSTSRGAEHRLHAASGAVTPSAPAPTSTPSGQPRATSTPAPATTTPVTRAPSASSADSVARAIRVGYGPVGRALAHHKAVVALFYNPRGSDDQEVRRALHGVDRHGGRVVVVAMTLTRAARFPGLARAVPVLGSPTVLIVGHGRAQLLSGLTDSYDLNQRLDDALARHAAR